MKFGNYYLGQIYSEMENSLKELTNFEKTLIPKAFKKENYFRGEMVTFGGTEWTAILSFLEDKIYKINLSSVKLSQTKYQKVLSELLIYFENELGVFNKRGCYYILDNMQVEVRIDIKEKTSLGIQILSTRVLEKQSIIEAIIFLLKVPFKRMKIYFGKKKSEKLNYTPFLKL